MKALRKTRPEKGAELVEIPVPPVGDQDISVKVKATAICGSDIHIYGWNAWAQQRLKLPMTFGHEFCGEVVEVGKQVTHLKPGDLVAAETHIPCGQCYQCRTGNQHVCEHMSILGVHTVGLTGEPVTLNTCDDITYKETTVKGTTGRLMWKTWYQMDRLLASGRFDPRQVITHRFPLADFDEAFALAASAKAGKILLIP